MVRTIGLILTLAYFSAIAAAQSSPDPLDACAQLTDANARLTCFDREMQRRHATTAVAPTTATTPTVPTMATAPAAPPKAASATATAAADQKHSDDYVGLEGKQLHMKLKEQGIEPEPERIKPIVATVTRVLPRPDNEYALELDNGQTWEQAENKASFYIKPNETVHN